jgi:hypothetical protein
MFKNISKIKRFLFNFFFPQHNEDTHAGVSPTYPTRTHVGHGRFRLDNILIV